jgi:Cu/Ag efflux pump CusA
VVKVFGPDLDKLREIGTQIRDLAVGIPGLEDAKLDQTSLIPQLRIEPDRDRSTAYGVAPGHLNKQLATLIGGETVAELRDGVRTIDLVLRLPASWRELPEQISQLPVETEDGKHVPLELVAEVREAKGPNLIVRENSLRRFAVAIKPRSEDVGQLVSDLQEQVREKIALPEGYFVTYEGEFQAQEEASRRILWLTLAVFVFIAFLLGTYFGSPVFAFQVLCDIPLALIGGLLYTHMKSNNISIATLVGFIAVAGVAARNSIMLISHYLRLMRTGGWDFGKAMIIHGTRERLVPVLMTALTAGIGLIPLVMAADQPGKEILHPVAVVICGGLVTSTLLCLVVTPSMFHAFGRKAALKAVAARSPATQ